MKIGELLLNWQKEPVGVYLGDNNVFYIKNQKTHSYNNKQMLALFYQENGLQGVNLKGAYLRGADLSGAGLSGADLSGANLRGAYLLGVNLHRVHHNENTTWPEGFNKSRLSS